MVNYHKLNIQDLAIKMIDGDTQAKNQIINYSNLRGSEISNKTVGFIGLGNIALLTANILHKGFNMNVIGYNRSNKNIDYIKQYDIDYVLSNSDFIIFLLD